MKFFVCFLLLCTLASVLGDCVIRGTKLKEGETYSRIGACLKYTCGKEGSYSALGCPAFPDAPGCKRAPQDNTKLYPECCEHLEC